MVDGVLEEVLQRDWFYYGEWQMPLFSSSFWVWWRDDAFLRAVRLSGLRGDFLFLNGLCFLSQQDFDFMTALTSEACREKNEVFVASFSRASDRVFSEAFAFIPKLEVWNRGNRVFDSNALALFEEFIAVEKKIMCPWLVSCVLSDVFGEELAARCSDSRLKLSDVLALIPRKETLVLRQHREALKLKNKIAHNGLTPEISREIDEHAAKYEWTGTHHFWGKPYSREQFMTELPKLSAVENPTKALPQEVEFVARAGGELGFIRQYCAEVQNVVAYQARPLMTQAAAQLGLSYDGLLSLTPDEVIALLRANAKPDAAPLKARKRYGFCDFNLEGTEVVVTGENELAVFYAKLVHQNKTPAASVKELRGRGACPGKARGAARIFLVPENLEKMRDGDVLIAPMTTPDFVPIMKRAAAIVTDNGGLLSHAAIVSRELGVPCIVGTRSATRTFRDGDFVEVDGETGVISKVS